MTANGIVIRQADSPKDLAAVNRLISTGVDEAKLLPRAYGELEHLAERRQLWVADHVMGIIGCCALDRYTRKVGEIRSLYVMPEVRGNHAGSELVQQAILEAKYLGIEELYAMTYKVDFFKSNGFEELKDQTPRFFIWAEPYGKTPMFLKLG